MQFDRDDPGHRRIATFDIETTHYDPRRGEVVSVGVAVHDRDDPLDDADVTLRHRRPDRDEAQLVTEALDHLDRLDVDCLVSYNGRDFDVGFLSDRLTLLDEPPREPTLHTPDRHVDLLHDDRKDEADARGEKWPTLEESLAAYGHTPDPQTWRGSELTNVRFGDELGPEYLNAIADGDTETADDLRRVIAAYLTDDLRKNLRLYYYDVDHLQAEP